MSDNLSGWTELLTAPLGPEALPDLPISLLPCLMAGSLAPARSVLPLLEP